MNGIQISFRARFQKETESLEDYTEYFEEYCDAIGISEVQQLRLFMAYLNAKCRRRAKVLKKKLQSWDDVSTVLLRRGSREEKKVARSRLGNRKWSRGEDFEDYAADCLQLAQKIIPNNEDIAESMAIDSFISGLPDILLDRAEQQTTDDIMELARYVSSQANKLSNREQEIHSKVPFKPVVELQENSRPKLSRARYISASYSNNSHQSGHQEQTCRNDSPTQTSQPEPSQPHNHASFVYEEGHRARDCQLQIAREVLNQVSTSESGPHQSPRVLVRYPAKHSKNLFTVNLIINGCHINCRVVTGSPASFINYETYRKYEDKLGGLKATLTDYVTESGSILPLKGALVCKTHIF